LLEIFANFALCVAKKCCVGAVMVARAGITPSEALINKRTTPIKRALDKVIMFRLTMQIQK